MATVRNGREGRGERRSGSQETCAIDNSTRETSRVNQGSSSVPVGAVMVCGTTSNAGKSTIAAGLCRHYARRGVRVAPFKAQNMSNNAAVTAGGHEIARAQAWQAVAAGAEPDVTMNPVLLKPLGDRRCQVVVMGRPYGTMTAAEYHRLKPELRAVVLSALGDLRSRYDVVILEGAGSPAEINLLDADIVNLRIAHDAGIPAIIVGDIDPGGVFAALFGTVALLPDEYRRLVKGFVINKLRGDPALLFDATAELRRRCGVPTLGVLPWLDTPAIDSEDSLALERPLDPGPGATVPARPLDHGALDHGALDHGALDHGALDHGSVDHGAVDHGALDHGAADQGAVGDLEPLDVAVIRLPRIANFTDLDPLRLEPGVRLRWVEHARSVGQPDLLVLPGSKTTAADLAWVRSRGLDRAIGASRGAVLGICAGYQMLGATLADPGGVESADPKVPGLGLLDVRTCFRPDKVTRQRRGWLFGQPVSGYQIHHGVAEGAGPGLVTLEDGSSDGAVGRTDAGGIVWGTSLHGLLDADAARAALLDQVAQRAEKRRVPGPSYEAARQGHLDALADAIERHVELASLDRILALGVAA
jgi:adenosylcobyric acid synthase